MFGNGHSLPHGLNLPSYTEIENTQTTNGLSGGASPFVLARFHDASFFSTADLLAVPLFWAGAQRLRRQREAGGCWRPRHGQQANIAINRQRHSSCRPWLTSLQTLGPEHVLHVPAKLWAKSSKVRKYLHATLAFPKRLWVCRQPTAGGCRLDRVPHLADGCTFSPQNGATAKDSSKKVL